MHLVIKGGPASVLAIVILAISWSSFPASASTVILRDSIGPDNSTTNDHFVFNTSDSFSVGGNRFVIPIPVTPNQDVLLKEFDGVFAQTGALLNFSHFDYFVRIWSSQQAAIDSPGSGDISNIEFLTPSNGPTQFGSTGDIPFTGVEPTWLLSFDISAAAVHVPAGGSVAIGVSVITDGNGAGTGGGFLGLVESSELGTSDIQVGNIFPGGWRNISEASSSLFDGRMGVRVMANTVPEPSTLAMGISGALSLAAFGRRLRRRTRARTLGGSHASSK